MIVLRPFHLLLISTMLLGSRAPCFGFQGVPFIKHGEAELKEANEIEIDRDTFTAKRLIRFVE